MIWFTNHGYQFFTLNFPPIIFEMHLDLISRKFVMSAYSLTSESSGATT